MKTPATSKPEEQKMSSKMATGLVVAMMAVAVASTATIVKLWPNLPK